MLDNVFKNDMTKALEKAKCTLVSTLNIAWNDENKVLVVIEKRQNSYDIHAIRIYLVEDKMHKVSASATTDKISSLGSVLATKIHNVSVMQGKGSRVKDPHTCLEVLFTVDEYEEESTLMPIVPMQELNQYPTDGGLFGYVCDPYLNPTKTPLYITPEMVLHHIIVSGSTGFGKTSILFRIITELNKENITVLVLTPESHLQTWKSLANSIEIDEEVREGKVNILNLSYANNLKEESSRILKELIDNYSTLEETRGVRLTLVIDESEQFDQERIEECVRTLRKFGIGVIVVSHKFTGDGGVNGSIRANVNTHISTQTAWEPDIQEMRKYQPKKGSDFAGVLRVAPRGFCVVRSSFLNRGLPTPCKVLREYEKLQYVESSSFDSLPKVTGDQTHERKRTVLDVIRRNAGITAEEIMLQLKIPEKEKRSLYRTVRYLENENLVIVTTGDKNRKHYTVR